MKSQKFLMQIYAACCLALIAIFQLTVSSNAYETIYNKGKGIENLSWCTDPGRAKSKLKDKNLKKCGDDFIRHGNKSENQLGLSAIKEICLGHDGIAKKLVKACQCHNDAGYNAVMKDWPKVVAWAKKHPYCAQWTKWGLEAQSCKAQGNNWNDNTHKCDVATIGTQIDSACISRRLVTFDQTSTDVEVSNRCGQCTVVRWQKTLNGQPEYGLFNDQKLQAGSAFTVRMQTGKPGTHDIAILSAFACP